MGNALNRYINTIPKVFKPETNLAMHALLVALATNDDQIEEAIALGKKQLFVRTATGKYLDILGRSLGVQRPPTLGLQDDKYQELIPNLSLKPKQIRKAFYDTADVFWGPLFSRTNITTHNSAPFDIQLGDVISVSIDGGPVQNIKVLVGDVQTLGSATADEVIAILSRIKGATPTIQVDPVSGDQFINLRTNTPGSVGTVEILDSTMISPTKLDFTVGKYDILDLDQRVVVYNIRPNELFIEIPAVVPALRRTLKGSHHFHADATIEPPVAPDNGIWQGSFFYNPTGSVDSFTISSQHCEIQQILEKQSVYTSVAVDDNSSFKSQFGQLIFGFGTKSQEGPVKFRGIPNSNTILIDPSYVFKFDHSVGESINVITQQKPYVPRIDGTDLAIYLNSPSQARQIVQDILTSLAAAGIIVNFRVLAPKYRYILDNPYISDDDEPEIE